MRREEQLRRNLWAIISFCFFFLGGRQTDLRMMMEGETQTQIFSPPLDVSSRAYVPSLADYEHLYKKSITHPDDFWAEIASKDFFWQQKWDQVCGATAWPFRSSRQIFCLE